MACYTGANLFRGATSFGGTGYTAVSTFLALGGRFRRRRYLMQERNKLSGGSCRSAFVSSSNFEADVLPDGKTSFSLTMTCLRSGAAKNTLLIQPVSPGNPCSHEPEESDC
jgi:hypothetical protein